MSLVTLITDFGTKDWFAGVMKGVLLRIHPGLTITDITHDIAPGDIRAGAFALKNAHRYFPHGTVHVVVVDPGVGSARHPLAVKTPFATYVGPDNGVLSWALKEETEIEIRHLDNTALFLKPVSQTFHGRDIFAPVAAFLAGGGEFSTVGSLLPNLIDLPWPAPHIEGASVIGEVISIDRFGNAITNLSAESLRAPASKKWLLEAGNRHPRISIGSCYSEAKSGGILGLMGSAGFLEIVVNGGSAAADLDLKIGSSIRAISLPKDSFEDSNSACVEAATC